MNVSDNIPLDSFQLAMKNYSEVLDKNFKAAEKIVVDYGYSSGKILTIQNMIDHLLDHVPLMIENEETRLLNQTYMIRQFEMLIVKLTIQDEVELYDKYLDLIRTKNINRLYEQSSNDFAAIYKDTNTCSKTAHKAAHMAAYVLLNSRPKRDSLSRYPSPEKIVAAAEHFSFMHDTSFDFLEDLDIPPIFDFHIKKMCKANQKAGEYILQNQIYVNPK